MYIVPLRWTIDPGSETVRPPEAVILTALRGLAAFKTDLIPLSKLDGPHQLGFFQFAGLDIVTLRDYLDLFKFHF